MSELDIVPLHHVAISNHVFGITVAWLWLKCQQKQTKKQWLNVLLTVSIAPSEPVRQSKYESFQVYAATHKTDEQKKEEVSAFLQICSVNDS